MRHVLAAITVLLLACVVQAAPFAAFPVDAAVTHCDMKINAGAVVRVPATSGKCRVDVGAVPLGTNTVTCATLVVDPIWGTSAPAATTSFTFARPALAPVAASTGVLEP